MASLAALLSPFAAAERTPESPTGSDEASGCAVDLQRLEQRRTSSQPPLRKVDTGQCPCTTEPRKPAVVTLPIRTCGPVTTCCWTRRSSLRCPANMQRELSKACCWVIYIVCERELPFATMWLSWCTGRGVPSVSGESGAVARTG